MLPNQNKINTTQQILTTMGITQWHRRDAIFTSPHHTHCLFYVTLTHSLNKAQKTFTVKLYQAIEKLLTLAPSDILIQPDPKQSLSLDPTKIKLIFKHDILAPTVREKTPTLIIDLPNISLCEKTPIIKSTLWKLLKDNIS